MHWNWTYGQLWTYVWVLLDTPERYIQKYACTQCRKRGWDYWGDNSDFWKWLHVNLKLWIYYDIPSFVYLVGRNYRIYRFSLLLCSTSCVLHYLGPTLWIQERRSKPTNRPEAACWLAERSRGKYFSQRREAGRCWDWDADFPKIIQKTYFYSFIYLRFTWIHSVFVKIK